MLNDGTNLIDGLPVLTDAYLLLFKAKAVIDLSKRRILGEKIDSRDIKKHQNDCIRLATIVNPVLKYKINKEVMVDLEKFIEILEKVPIDLKSLGLSGYSYNDIIDRLKFCYEV